MADSQKGILIVALPQRGKLPAATYELISAGKALAESLKEPLSAVTFGAKAKEFASDLIEHGLGRVVTIDHALLDNFNDELHTKAVAALVEKEKFGRVLIPTTVAGRSLAARLAVTLKAGLASEICELASSGSFLKAKRYHYSGNIISELEFKAPIQVVTVQPMVFPRADKKPGSGGETVAFPFDPGGAPRTEFVSYQAEEASEVDLGTAERIVSGGRGLGNAEGFKLVGDLAHSIGAAVGASRAVVDVGWIPYRHQVGLTGRTVHPKLYIACGISGQIQHLAGMASSGTIVAINTDPDCPMMQLASLSVVGDVYEIVPAVIEEIKKRKGAAVAA